MYCLRTSGLRQLKIVIAVKIQIENEIRLSIGEVLSVHYCLLIESIGLLLILSSNWKADQTPQYAAYAIGSMVLYRVVTENVTYITKTRLFKYIENFISKNWKFSDKNTHIFQISAQNIDCGYPLEPPRRGGSNEYPQSMFWADIRNIMYTPVNPSFSI